MAAFDPDLLHLRLISFARASLWPWWHLDTQTQWWVLWANDRAGASVVHQRRRFPLLPHRVMLLRPGTHFVTTPGPEVRQFYVHLEVIGLPPETAQALAPGPIDLGDDPVLAAQSRQFHQQFADQRAPSPVLSSEPAKIVGPEQAWAVKAFAHQAFSRLIAQASAPVRATWTDSLRHAGPIAPAIQHIEHHLATPVSVPALARLCNLGPQWFTKQFQRSTGLTPALYITTRRCNLAAQRLIYGDDSIDSISDSLGFADRAYFTRVFTRIHGVAPARYRSQEQRKHGLA